MTQIRAIAQRVVLAEIKELHEHYFGSLFVNNFPSFQNQLDPIMKQSVQHTLSPNCQKWQEREEEEL